MSETRILTMNGEPGTGRLLFVVTGTVRILRTVSKNVTPVLHEEGSTNNFTSKEYGIRISNTGHDPGSDL